MVGGGGGGRGEKGIILTVHSHTRHSQVCNAAAAAAAVFISTAIFKGRGEEKEERKKEFLHGIACNEVVVKR